MRIIKHTQVTIELERDEEFVVSFDRRGKKFKFVADRISYSYRPGEPLSGSVLVSGTGLNVNTLKRLQIRRETYMNRLDLPIEVQRAGV
jgi:hypothetical protein